jgi:Glycosyltransferase
LHPDLGIGGAEQLVVNLAVALQQKGHFVKIYTPHHDPNHCFKETRDGTLNVEVRGSIFPREIMKKFTALCAMIRMILAALYVILYGGKYDVVIVDQVSACVPLLRLFNRRVIFYCHFPDKLLCVDRRSPLKRLYRFFLDLFEEITTGFANLVLVNSGFTKEVFKNSFKILNKLGINPDILYPALDLSKFDNVPPADEFIKKIGGPFFLSLNRYERKKGIGLAIQAYSEFKKKVGKTEYKLVIAGGYDTRVTENVEHLEELRELAKKEGLIEGQDIHFLCSVSDVERANLLKNCFCVLYTPENEHFGIVPTEAMYMERPVIACNSGGPKESVLNGKTGYLLEPNPKQWGEKMFEMTQNPQIIKQMGIEGRKNVKERFGLEAFANQLNNCVLSVVSKQKRD